MLSRKTIGSGNVNAARQNGPHRDFYTGSLFLKSYIQSFDSVLNPTRLILPLCRTLQHKMQHPTAKCITLLQCMMQTYNTNEITMNYKYKIYSNTLFKYSSTEEHMIFKLQYLRSQHNNQKSISIQKESLTLKRSSCWMNLLIKCKQHPLQD